MIKIIKYFFQSLIIYTFFLIIKILGLTLSKRIFIHIFKLVGPLIRSTSTINKNLEIILGIVNKEKEKEISSNMWSNYACTFVEYLFLKKFRKENYHINIKNKEILEKIIKDNKPCIFISGHFGNFELMSMELTKAGINLATIYRPLNNFFINPFMEILRKKFICKNQVKKGRGGLRKLIDYLNKNCSIALMVDQRVSEGEKLPFFKRDAYTTTIPAQLALRYKYNIVPIYIERKIDGKFEMEIFEPINIDHKDNTKFNKLEITLKINEIIEKFIIKNPSQWILTHNRWK